MYDPIRGRFINRDPAGYADGMVLYEYVGSRPVAAVDPHALWHISRWLDDPKYIHRGITMMAYWGQTVGDQANETQLGVLAVVGPEMSWHIPDKKGQDRCKKRMWVSILKGNENQAHLLQL